MATILSIFLESTYQMSCSLNGVKAHKDPGPRVPLFKV